MYIKGFKEKQVRVADPLHPGKKVFEQRLIPTGGNSVHTHLLCVGKCKDDCEGRVYRADEGDLWIDVPNEVGAFLRKFRGPQGETLLTPDELDEEVAVGRATPDAADAAPGDSAKRTKPEPPPAPAPAATGKKTPTPAAA